MIEINRFMKRLCDKSENLIFLNNADRFSNNDIPKRNLFSDQDGVHLSQMGKEILTGIFTEAVKSAEKTERSRKRSRDSNMTTPQSVERIEKTQKTGQ